MDSSSGAYKDGFYVYQWEICMGFVSTKVELSGGHVV